MRKRLVPATPLRFVPAVTLLRSSPRAISLLTYHKAAARAELPVTILFDEDYDSYRTFSIQCSVLEARVDDCKSLRAVVALLVLAGWTPKIVWAGDAYALWKELERDEKRAKASQKR